MSKKPTDERLGLRQDRQEPGSSTSPPEPFAAHSSEQDDELKLVSDGLDSADEDLRATDEVTGASEEVGRAPNPPDQKPVKPKPNPGTSEDDWEERRLPFDAE